MTCPNQSNYPLGVVVRERLATQPYTASGRGFFSFFDCVFRFSSDRDGTEEGYILSLRCTTQRLEPNVEPLFQRRKDHCCIPPRGRGREGKERKNVDRFVSRREDRPSAHSGLAPQTSASKSMTSTAMQSRRSVSNVFLMCAHNSSAVREAQAPPRCLP